MDKSNWASVVRSGGFRILWDNKLVSNLKVVILELDSRLESHWSVKTGRLKGLDSLIKHWAPETDIRNTDVHLFYDLLEHLNSGLNTTGTELIGLFSVKGKSLEGLEDDLCKVLLGESDLSKVSEPVVSEKRFEKSMNFLWQERVLLENGSEVELNSGKHVRLEDWELSVGGKILFLWLVTGESSNVLIGFLLHLRDDVSKNWLFWESFHHSPEGSHTEFWLVLTVLVDWKENFLDLAWHNILEKTESINRFSADSNWLTCVLDELDELVNGHANSGVSESLERKNLLVSRFGTAKVLHEDADVLLLELVGSWTGQWKILSHGGESADNGSGGKPSRLTEWLVSLSEWGLGKFDEKIGDVLT
ncbi:hypothetical protein GCK72_023946 [Caenorhabditis remanei]|uniref:Uncharacterized protein n=1 Tax=Caenorhabditis remanei TaxID=31234 RepID=A0A6A5FY90_CAERE|nr:hypothetical protein GCK72_023946 [Caenorhabditis remanei]KAF1747482.1 hypothetical protein GCK72_023946 [Caenorhabditis remanei]